MKRESASPALTVYLVEDSDLLASRLAEIIEQETGVRLVGRGAEADQAIAAISQLGPDIAIVDLSLRKGTGFEVLRAVSMLEPAPLCVVLSNHSSPEYRCTAEQFGVSGDHFFDKTEQLPSCMRLIRDIADQKLALAETGEASDGREHEQDHGGRSGQSARRAGGSQVRH